MRVSIDIDPGSGPVAIRDVPSVAGGERVGGDIDAGPPSAALLAAVAAAEGSPIAPSGAVSAAAAGNLEVETLDGGSAPT
jgi:hypothetical protein